MRSLNPLQKVGFIIGGITVAFTAVLLSLCTKDNPTTPEESTYWSMEGKIVNGNGGQLITDTIYIKYLNDNARSEPRSVMITTGQYHIDSLSPGEYSFVFTDSKTNKPSVRYTENVLVAKSAPDTTSSDKKKLQTVTKIVKLFPLTGKLTGSIKARVNKIQPLVSAAKVPVIIRYLDPAMQTSSHSADTASSDASGVFKFSNLPVGAESKVEIAGAVIEGVDYRAETFVQPVLIGGKEVPMGTVTMWPIDAKKFSLISKSYTTVVGTNDALTLTFTADVDSLSYATIEGTGSASNVEAEAEAEGAKLVVKPASSLVDGSSYKVTVYAYGKKGGDTVITSTVEAKGKGLVDVVSSNVLDGDKHPLNGLGLTDSMIFTFGDTIVKGNATVTEDGQPVLVTTVISGPDFIVKPKGQWKSTTYTVEISVTLKDNSTVKFHFNITTVGALDFVSSNVYNPASYSGINGIGIKDTISFVANKKLASAQATLTRGGVSVPITVTVKDAAVAIAPVDYLLPATEYRIVLTIKTAEGETKSIPTPTSFTTAQSDFYPVTSNVRYNNNPNEPVLDFAPNGVIVIVMNSAVQFATANLVGNYSIQIQSDVKIAGDTIKVIPQQILNVGSSYTLSVEAKSAKGVTYSAAGTTPFVQGLLIQNKVRVLASNVLSADGIGLSDIPVTTKMFYVLSATPDASTLAITVTPVVDPPSPAIDKNVSVKGDTITVSPVKNLAAATTYSVTIKGKSTAGNIIDLSLTSTRAFTTRTDVYMVATNMQDNNGNPKKDLLPNAEFWVKFSRPLADASKQEIGGGTGTSLTYKFGQTSNNATIRVSGDTLFAKFQPNALPAYGATVSLRSILLAFNDETKLGAGAINIDAQIVNKAKPYVIATNGIKSNVVVDTFGVLSEAWIVSSLSFKTIDKIKDGPDGYTDVGTNNLVLTNVRKSATGDTIFFKPALRLGYDTEYQVAFEVTLSDSTKYTGSELKLRWKTLKGLYIVSANDMDSNFTAYRPFAITGDNLVLTFNKAIDITKPFSITGFETKLTYSWNETRKTVTINSLDTLKVKAYSPNPDYKLDATGEYSPITITATVVDGQEWAGQAANTAAFDNARPALVIHTVNGIEVLNTNAVVSNVTKQAYTNVDNRKLSDLQAATIVVQNDSVNTTDTLKVVFNRAVDSARIAANPEAYVKITQAAVPVNCAISYLNDKKTMLIRPLLALAAGTSYTLTLSNVYAQGCAFIDGNAKVSYTLLFKTRPAATKPVSSATPALAMDTAVTQGVVQNNVCYSGNQHIYAGNTLIANAHDRPAANTVKLMWKAVSWRSISDTVSHYQYAVKGWDGNWRELRSMVAAAHYDPFNPLADSLMSTTLDLSGIVYDINTINIGPTLRKAAKYSNTAGLFNDSAKLAVKIRPVLSDNATWSSDDKAGTWSTEVVFQDNVAPCDSGYVANSTNLGTLMLPAWGGVSVSSVPCPMDLSAPGSSDGEYTFYFKFPEDMGISADNKPTIGIFLGISGGTLPSNMIRINSAKSYWTSATEYTLTVIVPAGANWPVTYAPYYSVSVAGVKDASGVPIMTWGSTGTAAHNVLITAAIATEAKGTVNMKGLSTF